MRPEDPPPATDWPTGFMLLQGNRLEELRALMVAWIRHHPLAPLENETILVQSSGMAQWLKLALAAPTPNPTEGGLGIAAAIEVMLPAQFIWRIYRAVLGELPEASPFDKAPLTWRIYRLLDQERLMAEGPHQLDDDPRASLAPLRRFLMTDEVEGDLRRRHQLAEQLADLFDQYQVYRADWLAAWAQGRDILISHTGHQVALPPHQAWQPALWRALLADVRDEFGPNTPPLRYASRAEVHQRFLAQTVQGAGIAPNLGGRLPRRVIVFGLSSLPRQMLEVLEAIAPVCQVMLFVLNPCRHYWGDIIEDRDLFRRPRKVPEGCDEREFHLHGHPLLAAWGKQGRDYLRLLDEHDNIDLFTSPGTGCLLHQLQDDILELRPLHECRAQGRCIDPEHDRSLEFIVAHSPQREIEVLHDRLLDAFEHSARTARPLQPREVLVMVPDIAVHAPHIQAVFGRFDRDDPRYIPFQIVDQGQRRRHPILVGLEHLLNLPQSRCLVSELFDLLDIPAVCARYDLDATDLPQLKSWITGANVRWGLNAEQRASLNLPQGLEQNTWRFGLNRLLLGFASGKAGPWRNIEPHDEVGGLKAALLGPLACLLKRLESAWPSLSQPHSPSGWVDLVGTLIDDFFAESNESDGIMLERILQELNAWETECLQGGLGDDPIAPETFRDTFLARFDQPTLTQRFLTGAVTFATLMPMRAIPFRHIWLLGMNDGDYPRQRAPADLDLMANDYRPGDRSRRDDDRYLFLEALLSARDKLVIGWVGRDIRDNSERSPSVLVGQLRDHLDAGWSLPAGQTGGVAAALTTEYPLQPFSRRYFATDRLKSHFTYAYEWQAAHEATSHPKLGSERLTPWWPETPVDLKQLRHFLRDPITALFKERLKITPPGELVVPPQVETFKLTGLEFWRIQEELIRLTFAPNLDPKALEQRLNAGLARLKAQGCLPAGALGDQVGREVIAPLPALYQSWQAAMGEWPRPLDRPVPIRLKIDALGAPLRLDDVLSDLREGDDGRGQIILQASGLTKNRHYQWRNTLRAWVRHLAAQLDGEPVTTHLLTPSGEARLDPVPVDEARDRLAGLLVAWGEGMQRPLPVTLNAAMAWLDKDGPKTLGDDAVLEGLLAWNAASQAFDRDRDHYAYVGRCYSSFKALWSGGEFAHWAYRLYGELHAAIKSS
ncbi:MAG: exodeoxyribonuclease V subunit gamma, partial [Thermochromatium sp.]